MYFFKIIKSWFINIVSGIQTVGHFSSADKKFTNDLYKSFENSFYDLILIENLKKMRKKLSQRSISAFNNNYQLYEDPSLPSYLTGKIFKPVNS